MENLCLLLITCFFLIDSKNQREKFRNSEIGWESWTQFFIVLLQKSPNISHAVKSLLMVDYPFFLLRLLSSSISLLDYLVLFPSNTECITSPHPNTEAAISFCIHPPVIAFYSLAAVPDGHIGWLLSMTCRSIKRTVNGAVSWT